MGIILEILQSCVELNQDIEVRMDALVLVEFIISLPFKDVREKVKENSHIILAVRTIPLPYLDSLISPQRILIPSIVWKVGKP